MVKIKRTRTLVSNQDLIKLEAIYKKWKWPSKFTRQRTASELHKSQNFVTVWFQNRRAKDKRASQCLRLQGERPTIALHGDISQLIHRTASRGIAESFENSPAAHLYTNIHTKSYINSQVDGMQRQQVELEHPSSHIHPNKHQDCDKSRLASELNRGQNTHQEKMNHSSRIVKVQRYDVFHQIVGMAAAAEGGVIDPNDAEYTDAVNAALYGLRLANNDRLVYDTHTGFYIQEVIELL